MTVSYEMLDVVEDAVAVEGLADAIEPRIGFDLDEVRRVLDHHRRGLDVGDLDFAELAFSSRHGFEDLRLLGKKSGCGGRGGCGEKTSSIEHGKLLQWHWTIFQPVPARNLSSVNENVVHRVPTVAILCSGARPQPLRLVGARQNPR